MLLVLRPVVRGGGVGACVRVCGGGVGGGMLLVTLIRGAQFVTWSLLGLMIPGFSATVRVFDVALAHNDFFLCTLSDPSCI